MNFPRPDSRLARFAWSAFSAVGIWFSIAPAAAEIGYCVSCHIPSSLTHAPMTAALTPIDVLGWIRSQGDLQVAPVLPNSYQATAMSGLSDIKMEQSGLKFANAPIIPSQAAVNWDDGMELPGAFRRPWDLPKTDFNPAFITSFYHSDRGFTADPMTAPLVSSAAPTGTGAIAWSWE